MNAIENINVVGSTSSLAAESFEKERVTVKVGTREGRMKLWTLIPGLPDLALGRVRGLFFLVMIPVFYFVCWPLGLLFHLGSLAELTDSEPSQLPPRSYGPPHKLLRQ